MLVYSLLIVTTAEQISVEFGKLCMFCHWRFVKIHRLSFSARLASSPNVIITSHDNYSNSDDYGKKV
jgi:hypothetical protein